MEKSDFKWHKDTGDRPDYIFLSSTQFHDFQYIDHSTYE